MLKLIQKHLSDNDISYQALGFHSFYKIIIIFSFCNLLFSEGLWSQYQVLEDLEKMLPELTADTEIIDALNKLSYEYYMIDIEKAEMYSLRALQKSKEINYQYGISQALNYLSIAYAVKGNQLKSIELNEESLKIAEEMGESFLISNASNDLGVSYNELGFSAKALQLFQTSLKYSAKTKDDKLTCFTLENIAYLYYDLGEEKKAEEYGQRIIEIAEKSDHHMLQSYPDLFLARDLIEEGEYEEALLAYDDAYIKSYGLIEKSSICLEQAYILELQEKYSAAEDKILKALKLINRAGNKEELQWTTIAHANVLIKSGQFEKAIFTINEILTEKAEIQINPTFSKELLGLRMEAYRSTGDFEAAANDFDEYLILQDSIFSKQKLKLITEVETKYKLEEKEKENQFLRIQSDNDEVLLAEQRRNAGYLGLLILFLFLLLLFLYRSYRNKQAFNSKLKQQVALQTKELKQYNEQLKESNEELERFAFIASHDLKTPLRTIISFTGLLERKLKSYENESVNEYVSYIKTAGVRMNELIVDVLEYSRLSSSDESNKKDAIDPNILLNEVLSSFSNYLKEKNAEVIKVNDLPYLSAHKSSISLLFQNLIENSIKYNESDKPSIKIHTEEKGEFVSIYFEDNGIGIPEEYQEKIFGMFSRLHNQGEYEGSGLGLSTCKKIVEKLNGEIIVESTVGEGSIFEIVLPQSIIVSEAVFKSLKISR
ncbi:MAG: signal transduction histidine kinase [Saprospiraceae bacterium]|jgi:signal transduction histidine kinase